MLEKTMLNSIYGYTNLYTSNKTATGQLNKFNLKEDKTMGEKSLADLLGKGDLYFTGPMFTFSKDVIKNVIFSGDRTIVIWADGTKRMVKCENENFDKEKGLAMAIAKKVFGNQGSYYNEFKKWLKNDD